MCFYKHKREWRRCAGFGEKEWDFVPAEASGSFADGGRVPGALELGGPGTEGRECSLLACTRASLHGVIRVGK